MKKYVLVKYVSVEKKISDMVSLFGSSAAI